MRKHRSYSAWTALYLSNSKVAWDVSSLQDQHISSKSGIRRLTWLSSTTSTNRQPDVPPTDIILPPALEKEERSRDVKFMSPLLEYGYRPAVEEYENKALHEKPILLYLPGFDGTFLSPFLQMPELHTLFDVWCMEVSMQDRSTVAELKNDVVTFLVDQCQGLDDQPPTNATNSTTAKQEGKRFSSLFTSKEKNDESPRRRQVYLAGESFGGILAAQVALSLPANSSTTIDLKGLILINAALCYDRSRLAIEGPKVAALNKWLYLFGLVQMLSIFSDKHSFEQLLLILQAKALPSIIDSETKEAYLGRVALSLPFILPFMSQDTLRWRLSEWLQRGCSEVSDTNLRSIKIRSLIIAGESDGTLPSIDEAERLAGLLPDARVHVVPEAGHASTCGSRLDLAALCRGRFRELRERRPSRTSMKKVAANGTGPFYGMEPRYDNATVGLNPLWYWSRPYYRKCKQRTVRYKQ